MATRDGVDVMQARRGIEHQVARRKLDLVHAVLVLHRQFAAVVLLGLGQEQRHGEVGADAQRRAGNAADGIVDMRAEVLADAVSVEERGEDLERQCRRDEERAARQGLEHDVAQFPGRSRTLGKLHVVLHGSRLGACGHAAINPIDVVHDLTELRDLRFRQHFGNAYQHVFFSRSSIASSARPPGAKHLGARSLDRSGDQPETFST